MVVKYPSKASEVRFDKTLITFLFTVLAEVLLGKFTKIAPDVKLSGQLLGSANPRSRVMMMASVEIATCITSVSGRPLKLISLTSCTAILKASICKAKERGIFSSINKFNVYALRAVT